MENRLLLAFVLSLAVFVGWGYFLAQIQGPLPEQEPGMADIPVDAQAPIPQTQTPGSTPSALSQSDPSQPVASVPAPVNPFPGEEVLIQVSTGKSHFVISNRGGILKKLELPRAESFLPA